MLSDERSGGGWSALDVREGIMCPPVAQASPSYGRCGMAHAPGGSVEARSSDLAGLTTGFRAEHAGTLVYHVVPAEGTPTRGFGPR
jgi:hypothetical protein